MDGLIVGALPPFGSTELTVSPGSHRIGVRFENEQSRDTVIEVARGETKYLTCLARPGMAWFNPMLAGRFVRFKVRESTEKELRLAGIGLGRR
jgi:hypothetical protein